MLEVAATIITKEDNSVKDETEKAAFRLKHFPILSGAYERLGDLLLNQEAFENATEVL